MKKKKRKKPLKEGNYVKISVADTGFGISQESLLKIFDPYFTTKKTGHGLGLATTYSIIKNHNGYIEVESELDVGTVFTFYLIASHQKIICKETENEKVKTENLRILILKDEENITDFLKVCLTSLGHEVIFTKDGKKTLEIYKKSMKESNPFDIVILDLTIPGGLGGKETLKKLLKIDPEVKAIVCSDYSNDSIMANYKESGFKNRITKPYLVEDLSKIV